jgi:phosphinothricin acetyltransferase
MIRYFENDIKKEDLEDLNVLLSQLSKNAKPINWERVKESMNGGFIFSARNKEKLVGITMLIPITKLTSFFGNVEEVVVLEDYRGQGIGKKLMRLVIKKGRSLKMKHLFLTSSKKRKTARHMYASFGFEVYNTTPFKLLF